MATVEKVFKTSVNLPDVTMASLEALAKKRGKSMSQVIRDAIATEQVLQEASESKAKVLIRETDGSVKQLIIR
ncbi:MAG: ribbon-helix-helix protein, CopG family [Panacagrimonas sp.]